MKSQTRNQMNKSPLLAIAWPPVHGSSLAGFVLMCSTLLLPSLMFSSTAAAQSSNSSSNSSASPSSNPNSSKSDRIDLQKLEDKYWEAKDTDMGVVQNRTYTKDKRYFLSASYGPLVNDAYSIGRMTNLAVGYYFNERWGIEGTYEQASLKENDATINAQSQNKVYPNYNKYIDWKGVSVVYVPFYAKMSFIDKAILYFDMQFALGMGSMTYESQIDPAQGSNRRSSAMGYNFDFTQQLFFSRHMAVRLDLKNKWSSQELLNWRVTGNNEDLRSLGKKSQQDTSFLIGLTFFW